MNRKEAIQIMSMAIIPGTIALILQSEFLGKENGRVVLIGNCISTGILAGSMIGLGLNFGIIGLAVSLILANTSKMIVFSIFKMVRRFN